MKIRFIAASIAGAAALAFGGIALAPTASAAAPSADPAGSITIIKAGPRETPAPGKSIVKFSDQDIKIAGRTFGEDTVPANASAVLINISNNQSPTDGTLTVWPAGNGKPGTPSISWKKGSVSTSQQLVPIGANGSISVSFGGGEGVAKPGTRYLMSILGFVAPLPAVSAPLVKTIAKTERAGIDVGGSIRTRSTLVGKVTLPAGTWDARVVSSYTGFNAKNNTVPADVKLTATMVLVNNDAAEFVFADVLATAGGVTIPDAQSETLTQDPTPAISTYITLDKETTVSVRLFASASDSSQAGSGELKAGLDSAVFVKVA